MNQDKLVAALLICSLGTNSAALAYPSQEPVKIGPLVDLAMARRNGVADSVPAATRSSALDSMGRIVRTGSVLLNGSGALTSQYSIGDEAIVRTGDVVSEIPYRWFEGVQAAHPTEDGCWWVASSDSALSIAVVGPSAIPPFSYGQQLLYKDSVLVAFIGMPLGPSGTGGQLLYAGASRGEAANARCILQRAGWWDTSTATGHAGAVKFRTDAAGSPLPPEIVLESGAPLAGGGGILFGVWNVAISSDERIAAALSTSTTAGAWVEGTFVLELGDPGPNPGETISDVWDVSVNRHGSWAAECDLNTGAHVIYRDGAVVMHGDTDFLPRRVTSVRGLHLTDRGDVFYEYWLDDFSSHIGCNGAPLISSDGATIGGLPVASIERPANPNPMVGPTASFLSFGGLVELPNGGFERFAAAHALELSDPVCGGAVSSLGVEPEFGVYRSDVAASDQTSVFSRHLPPSTPALVLAGRTTTFLPGAGGADGALCIGNPVRSRPQAVSANGTLEVFVDAALAEVGSALPAAGDFWAFQLWYRDVDPAPGQPTSRFTEAVSITFR